jgi:hypothetical protein
MTRASIRTPEKEIAFLAALSATCSVSKACDAAGVGRMTVYDWRKNDPDFAAAWDDAKKIGADVLEDEAVRRAHDGVNEPVFYQGVATGTIQRYSDTLLIFLLKGAKPDVYKDRVASEVSGPGGAPIGLDAASIKAEIAEIMAEVGADLA